MPAGTPPPGLNAAEQDAWQTMAAGHGTEGGALRPFFPARYTDPFTVEASAMRVVFRPLDASAVAAEMLDGKIVYRSPYPHTDSLHIISGGRSEEFLVLHRPEAPTRFEYEITTTSGVAQVALHEGAARFTDADGAILQIDAPWVVDATGAKHLQAAHWELSGEATDGSRRLTLTLDPAGLTYPLVVDPSWSITTGSFPANIKARRMHHTATLLPTGLVLVARRPTGHQRRDAGG